MGVIGALAGVALMVLILAEGFEAMVWPRRVTRYYRLTRWLYRRSWPLWCFLAHRLLPPKRQPSFLSLFGPLSLLAIFAVWMSGLVLAFGLLHWSLGTPVNVPPGETPGPVTYLYLSGVTLFTLGYGDVTASNAVGRMLTVAEAGLGFGFLAIIIGYLPVLYQAFSRRELTISLLDARAGSPPSAAQVLLRLAHSRHADALGPFLAEWERWAAEVLESHLSFPVLSFYRSQHDNQSWLAALTAVLDSCALVLAGVDGIDPYQARLTFAMARHTVVDLALVFDTPPRPPNPDRLPLERLAQLRALLHEAGLTPRDDGAADAKLAELRGLYEPFANALGEYFRFALPWFVPPGEPIDNWQTSAWTRRAAGLGKLPARAADDGHFD